MSHFYTTTFTLIFLLINVSAQVQYSLLDCRPLASGLVDICAQHGVKILAYGVLAGGFLTDSWLGAVKPSKEVRECS